jgi:PAS domain S-box-containing protein
MCQLIDRRECGREVELSKYELSPLREDGALILHRARSKEEQVEILVLSLLGERPSPESVKRLENEYSLREELNPAWATQPFCLTSVEDRTVLLLHDPGGLPLDHLLRTPWSPSLDSLGLAAKDEPSTQPLDIALALRFAIRLSAAIGALHRRGIIHKDIKPSNVLVSPITGDCWLTGFGIASRLPRERQTPGPPEFIAGTLPYIAPEQTGRMNRSIDSRSDLYAFGVTLYQILTGALPFAASDPMEWVHCHIARQPLPPDQRNEAVPAAVSAIVMKLLAKTAEERYQTAAGVQADLQRCLNELQSASVRRRIRHRPLNAPFFPQSLAPSDPQDPLLRRAGIPLPQSQEETISSTESTTDPPATGGALPSDQGTEPVAPFALGQHDMPDRLRIPEKLYGRDREIETLLASFDRVVVNGRPELVLVSGYSGIGKSSVVSELHKVLVPPRGLFASGKFDQYKRNIPYWTLAQAFQSLVRPLLAKSETELGKWREAFQQALGPNGRLIADLVPELELIIGQQPAVPDLAPQDAKARFQLVFRRFVSVFARAEHPLALFVDDLQWLDTATLDFLEDLLTQPDVHHLMLIGAYRDNEVDSTHPLWRKLDAIHGAGAEIHQIVLAPLTSEDLGRLLADALHDEPGWIAPLAHLVHAKTVGNPFFAIQFITALAEENFLSFNHRVGRWSWDLNRIQAKGYTDNVADLMVGKLNRLAIETRNALQEFASLGNTAAISTLSIVHRTPEEKLVSDLWQAERLEFIVRSEGFYKFAHDRVQEAAYSLIPASSRAETHLRIGRLLKAHTPPHKRDEAVFEIVSQLNRGTELITSRQEREELAELNLLAGKRAKASTAYASALKYLVSGATLLPDDAWSRNHDLAFALELNRAECEFLTGQLPAAEERLSTLSSHVSNTVELATVACLRMDLYTVLGQSDRAIEVCLDYLSHVNINWSPHPSDEVVRNEYDRIWLKLGNRNIDDLLDSPLMDDPSSFGTMTVFSRGFPPALFTDSNLMALIVCGAVNLSLDRGISDAACFAFAQFAMVAQRKFGDYHRGFRFGQVGYELVQRRGLRRFEGLTSLAFVAFVARWTVPVRASRDLLRHAFEEANRIGDLTFAAYVCYQSISDLLFSGDPLPDTQREAEHCLEFASRAQFGLVADFIATQTALIRTLRGLTPKFGHFDDERVNEHQMEHRLSNNALLAIAECWYWIRKMQARYLAGNYSAALESSMRAQQLLWTSPCFLEEAEYHFYSALSHSAAWDFAGAQNQQEHLEALRQHYTQFRVWAENCPENFDHRAALLGAEIARIEGRVVEAMDLYEQAIQSAHANGFVHNEALANELAARFYLGRGLEKIGRTYLREARHGYARWGANGKVRQLDERYPQLTEKEPTLGSTSTIGASVGELDLTTIVGALQALSGELVLEKLIDTLMRMVIEHAGAQRGLLLFARNQDQQIEAEATTAGDIIVVHLKETPVTEDAAPVSIIRYVARTRESVILDDALIRHPFSADSYLRQRHARSILCLPLINQTKLIGLLYLENNLTPGVFTPMRIAALNLLASQAAISLENTRLYRDLEQREAKIRRLVDANIIGICIWNFEGEIVEANEAFLQMLQYSREDLASRRLRWTDLIPKWGERDERAVAELKTIGCTKPFEKEYIRKDRSRVPVLVGPAIFEKGGSEAVAFVVDLSEQKRIEEERKKAAEALQKAQAELAHVSRVTTLGELSASIAHEINQPLTALVADGSACIRWIAAQNLDQARNCASRVIANGRRASDIIDRIRALAKKSPRQKDWLDLNDTIDEVLSIAGNQIQRNHVSLQTQLTSGLPPIMGDKIQLQQVILNLLVNAIEAMSGMPEESRHLWLTSEQVTSLTEDHILVAVRDSGPGLDPTIVDHLFDTFYTTKPQGLGMGLAISRTIIEAHGGRLEAAANAPKGAVFQFMLPIPNPQAAAGAVS